MNHIFQYLNHLSQYSNHIFQLRIYPIMNTVVLLWFLSLSRLKLKKFCSENMVTMILSIWVCKGICWISMVRNQKCTVRTCNTPITFLQVNRITCYQDIKMKWIQEYSTMCYISMDCVSMWSFSLVCYGCCELSILYSRGTKWVEEVISVYSIFLQISFDEIFFYLILFALCFNSYFDR